MKATIIEIKIAKPFDCVLDELKNQITANGFLLIYEINTQEILARSGMTVLPLRQLLFFHPVYMKQILDHDPLAVNEAPLKFVIRDGGDGKTFVSFPDPRINFSGYELHGQFIEELFTRVGRIISTALGN